MDIPIALLAQVVDINVIRRRIVNNQKIAKRERALAVSTSDPDITVKYLDTALAHEGIADALKNALETLFPVSELEKLPNLPEEVESSA